MMPNDTICAIATNPGQGAVGILRVSGPEAESIAGGIFRARHDRYPPFPSRRMILGDLHLPARDRIVPDCLLVMFYTPRSFTGEDVCELHCPGNPILLGEIIEELVRRGARPADRGEFTRRAWENGRIDLPAAEALNEIVRAHTREGMLLAASQMNRGLSEKIGMLRAELVEHLTAIEAVIEFDETDSVGIDREGLAGELDQTAAAFEKMSAGFSATRSLMEGCRVVIAGRANAGKSSLFNYLAGRPSAIVHHVPGTTRDLLKESVEISGVALTLLDTAGFRDLSGDAVEAEGIRRSRQALEGCDGVVVVLDQSSPTDEADEAVAELARRKPHVAVVNKIDLDRHSAFRAGLLQPAVEVSLLTGQNCEAVPSMIARVFGRGEIGTTPVILTLRQKQCVDRGAVALRNSAACLRNSESEEIAAEEVRGGIEALEELTGAIAPQEIVDRIFSDFCIGK